MLLLIGAEDRHSQFSVLFLSRSFMRTSWVEMAAVKRNILIPDSKATAEGVLPAFGSLDRLGPLLFQDFNDCFKIMLVNLFFPCRKNPFFLTEGLFWCLDFPL